MTNILLITQIILALILTISVLLQKSSSIGLGVYSGSNESLFGAKGPSGFMAKFTMAIGLLFIINTIALGYFYTKQTSKSIMDTTKIESPIPQAPENPLLSPQDSPFDSSPLGTNQDPNSPKIPSNK